MRSILVLLILVMIGLNGKGQSVTALPDSVLSQCCLEVTLLNGNVTTVDWVFIQYITRDGTGTKLFVEYAPNFGGIQWETQIRIQDDFDEVLERSKFIMLPFTVGSTDYAINRNWIANIEENTTTGGTWVYGRFGTPTKRKFSAVEDYETLKNLLLACRPRAIVVAENGLYTEGDTVRMGGFLIEPTTITTEGYNWQMKDTASTVEFGIDYNTPGSGDTTAYFARRFGVYRQLMAMGRTYWEHRLEDTTGVTDKRGYIINALDSEGNPYASIYSQGDNYSSWLLQGSFGNSWTFKDLVINPYYTFSVAMSPYSAVLGASESGTSDPGNGVSVSANGYGIGADEWIGIRTKNVDNGLAHPGQFLQLVDSITGKVEYATLDLSSYLEIGDTAAMLNPYINTAGWGLLKSPKTLRVDSSKVSTRYYAQTNPTSIAANLSVRSNGANLVAGNITDNGTKLEALKPWQFQTYTTAGLPTGVTGYTVYNTTLNGIGWYNGTRWAYGLESTFARGTSTYVPYFDANGQVTESSGIRYASAGLFIDGAAFTDPIVSQPVQFGATNSSVTTQKVYIQPKTGFGPLIGLQNGSKVGFVLMNSSGANEMAIGTYSSDQVHIRSNNIQRMTFYPTAQVDAVGLTNSFIAIPSIANTSFFTFSGTGGNAPYLGITNGTIRAFGAGIEGTDGSVFGSYSNHPTSIRSGGNVTRLQLSVVGTLSQLNTTTGMFLASGTTAQTPTEAGGLIRFNSDSTLYQIFSGGVRSYIATRAYARSIALNIGNSNLTLTGNRVLTGAGYRMDILGVSRFKTDSLEYSNFALQIRNNTTSSAILVGGSGNLPGSFTIQDRNSSGTQILKSYSELDKRRSTFGGFQWNLNETWQLPSGSFAWTRHVQFDTVGTDYFRVNNGSVFADVPTIHRTTAIGVNSSSILTQTLALTSTGSVIQNWSINGGINIADLYMNGTFAISQYGTGTKEAADLSKTQSNYLASWATDGTLLDYPLSSLGNGIYGGSGTLSQYTTRARVPDNGNLYFSQTYNSGADSTYWQIVNYGGGERAFNFGLTDTSSTGYSRAQFYSDGTGVMNWGLETSDALFGNTLVRAFEGDLLFSVNTGDISITAPVDSEVRTVGLVRAKQEAYYEINSTSSPQNLSNTYSDNFINQGGTQAAFTLVFPASPEDGQVLTITYNNNISTLTLDGNGNTIVGTTVTTAVAGSQRKFKFYAGAGVWIRIY
jgi:hypothetical protein